MRDITIRISLLDHLHTLRMCEAFVNDAPDAALEEHDSSYYVKLAQVVCGRVNGIQDDLMLATLEEYQRIYPEPLDYTNMSSFMAEIANDSVQNFNEHLSRNLQSIFCRLLYLDMSFDPNYDDEPQVLRKLALHVFKILSNQATVWPYSVPVTDDRIAKCQDLLDEYFEWFGFLSDGQENEVDEEFEEDGEDAMDVDELDGLLDDANQPIPQLPLPQHEQEDVIDTSFFINYFRLTLPIFQLMLICPLLMIHGKSYEISILYLDIQMLSNRILPSLFL